MTLLTLTIGGGFGALCRYIISRKIQGLMGIVLINWLGSFLIGIFTPLTLQTNALSMFLITGFLGAFTTFSTFAVQFVETWLMGKQRTAVVYAFLTVIGGFVFVGFGWWLETLINL